MKDNKDNVMDAIEEKAGKQIKLLKEKAKAAQEINYHNTKLTYFQAREKDLEASITKSNLTDRAKKKLRKKLRTTQEDMGYHDLKMEQFKAIEKVKSDMIEQMKNTGE